MHLVSNLYYLLPTDLLWLTSVSYVSPSSLNTKANAPSNYNCRHCRLCPRNSSPCMEYMSVLDKPQIPISKANAAFEP